MLPAMTERSAKLLVVFTLDGMRLALGIEAVSRVVRAAEISPLPGAPAGVRGVVNVQGEIVPVFDLRKRLGLAARALRASDHFVLARTGAHTVAVMVDTVIGVVEAGSHEPVQPSAMLLSSGVSIRGAVSIEGEIVLIHDLELFLSPEQETALAAALESK